MKALAFSGRNLKELCRDPLMLIFSVGFPAVVLLLLTAIQSNVPQALFPIDALAPGIAVFGLSFISLFSGMLIARDRSASFLVRLFASPMRGADFILGYTLPLMPIALAQSVICFGLSLALGLQFSFNLLLALAVLMPTAVLFIGLGLLLGTLVNDKAVGGIASILVNVAAWLSGTWFDLKIVGGAFETIGYCLPFAHAVDAARAASAGAYGDVLPHLWWVLGYGIAAVLLAILAFKCKLRSDRA